jgi:hypothetical protein
MKLKVDRIISIATLVASLVAIILVLKRPAPVAQPQSPAAIAANAQSFQQKMEQLEQTAQQGSPAQSGTSASSGNYQTSPSANPQSANRQSVSSGAQSNSQSNSPSKAEVHVSSDEVSAALLQALGAGTKELTADSNIGSSAPTIKDQQVSFEGDTVHGQFLTEIAGKDVWVTVSGHLASRDGYATFEPTEFKVGDLDVPVSLVNPALQKKLTEQRDRLKLPDYIGDMKVQNGELVMQQK